MKVLNFVGVLGFVFFCACAAVVAQGQAPFEQRGSFPDINVQSSAFTSSISIVPTGDTSSDVFANRVAVGAADDFAPKTNGMPGLGVRTGTVYIYDAVQTPNWAGQVTIFPQAATNNEKFGHSVSFIDENTIAIGAPHYDQVGKPDCGAVYIFERLPIVGDPDIYEWVQVQVISPDSLSAGDKFGFSVCAPKEVSRDPFSFVVGAPRADFDGKVDCGRVFVYYFDDVVANGEFVHAYSEYCPKPESNNLFGWNVSCNPDAFNDFCWVAGAPFQYNALSRTGAAYYYRTIDFDPLSVSPNKAKFDREKIVDQCGEDGAGFGWSVALSVPYKLVLDPNAPGGLLQLGTHLVVGAPFDDEDGIDDGSASVFIPGIVTDPFSDMLQIDKLRSQSPVEDGNFGFSVEVGIWGTQTLSHTDFHAVFVGAPGAAGDGVVEYFPPHVSRPDADYNPRGENFCFESLIWYNEGADQYFTGDEVIDGDRFGSDLSISLGDGEIGVISSTRRNGITNGNTYYFEKDLPDD